MNIVVIGATSGIGLMIAHGHARRGDRVLIAARDVSTLNDTAADLSLRYQADIIAQPVDMADPESLEALSQKIRRQFDRPPRVYLAAGIFPGAHADLPDFMASDKELAQTFAVNMVGPAQLLRRLLPWMIAENEGHIVAIGSVAGLKGKGNNPVYGATKAALHHYMEGLLNGLTQAGIKVTTVYPGYVDTAMVWGMKGLFLVQSPENAARTIIRGADRSRRHIYTYWPWFLILLILRLMPDFIFVKKPFVALDTLRRIAGKK